jgi:hypothetical protein
MTPLQWVAEGILEGIAEGIVEGAAVLTVEERPFRAA